VEKKKIVIFIPEFPRASETFIEREISKLVEFGNLDISVVSLAKASGEMSSATQSVIHYEKLTLSTALSAFFSYVVFHPLKILKIHKLILGKDPVPYLFNLKKSNAVEKDKRSALGRLHNARFIHFLKGIAYAKVFEKYSPDQIHAHFLSDPSTIAMVAAKVLNIPFSISGHARDVFVEGTLIPVKVREAKFIAICNKFAWQKCKELSGSENTQNVKQMYHGLDMNIFSSPPKMKKPDRPLIFLGGTRFVEKKGIKYMLEASKILKERGIAHQVDLVGSGPLYGEIKQAIADFGLEDIVVIHGEGKGMPFSKVAEFYKIADVFVLPCIETGSGDADGVPNVVLEAAVARLPIVTTNAGSVTDVITPEIGVLVPQKDPTAIADAVENLIFDSEKRKELGEKAYQRVKEMFDIEKNAKALEQLLLK
jgi:colanic acid/amylovoran biosynthesis glycosyltransferase